MKTKFDTVIGLSGLVFVGVIIIIDVCLGVINGNWDYGIYLKKDKILTWILLLVALLSFWFLIRGEKN